MGNLLLAVSVAALGAAALRVASLAAPRGLERVLAGAAIGAATAVIEALALALVGLGGTPAALSGATVIGWLVSLRVVPAIVPAGAELAGWWRRLRPLERAAFGALCGAGAAWAGLALWRPLPGYDGITYHLPEIVSFVQSGHPGQIVSSYYGLPVGNYPITNEVLIAWVAGITHGFAAPALWSGAAAALLLAAGWLGLRELRVAAGVRVLVLGALLAGPLLVASLPQPGTDLPAVAWLACTGALCLAARRRPQLLGPAILALALAVGTKTTTAVFGLVAVGAALWMQRRVLPWRSLSVAAMAGLVCGGTWYVRNLFAHGSPLWPFVATPWSDPEPPVIRLVDHTMAERLKVTLLDHVDNYVSGTSGSLVLLIGGLTACALAPRRRVLLAAGAVALGTLSWFNAPVTGLPDVPALAPVAGSAVRYLIPVFAAGALALALAATDGPRAGRLAALAGLAGAVVWGLVDDRSHQFFLGGSAAWLAGGVAAGGLAALTVRRSTLAALAALAVAAVAGLAVADHGFLARHGRVAAEWDARPAAWLAGRTEFTRGRDPIAVAPVPLGPLAGDHLDHRLTTIGEHEPCAQVLGRVRRGWVVLRVVDPRPVPGHPGILFPAAGTAQGCLARTPPIWQDALYRIYRGTR